MAIPEDNHNPAHCTHCCADSCCSCPCNINYNCNHSNLSIHPSTYLPYPSLHYLLHHSFSPNSLLAPLPSFPPHFLPLPSPAQAVVVPLPTVWHTDIPLLPYLNLPLSSFQLLLHLQCMPGTNWNRKLGPTPSYYKKAYFEKSYKKKSYSTIF